jgi:hypothetical protein
MPHCHAGKRFAQPEPDGQRFSAAGNERTGLTAMVGGFRQKVQDHHCITRAARCRGQPIQYRREVEHSLCHLDLLSFLRTKQHRIHEINPKVTEFPYYCP